MDNVKVMIQKTKEGISNNILASMSSGTHILSFNVKSTSIGKHTQQPNTESSSLLIQDSQGMRQSQEPRIAAMINANYQHKSEHKDRTNCIVEKRILLIFLSLCSFFETRATKARNFILSTQNI